MADNWWESASSSSRNRLERGGSPSSSTAALNSSSTTTNMASFGWPADIVDIKAARSCLDSVSSVSGNSSINNLFQDNSHKLGQFLSDHDHSTTTTNSGGGGGGGCLLASSDPSLQMMGLGLSSQASLDWNQSLFRGDQNRESNFHSMIQEDHMSSSNTSSFQQESGMSSSQDQWRSQKIYTGNSEDNSTINRGFSLDQNSSIITCQGLPTSFQMDSYGTLMGSENQPPPPQQQSSFSNYPSSYGSINVSTDQLSSSNWVKYPPFLRNSPPKVQPSDNQLHFSNNAPFWNASAAAPSMNDARSNFFPSLQMQLPPSNFDDKSSKNTSEVVKKSSSESSNKRPRNDNPSPLPAFKVRKEKMGDRITALQQLVSPFGKTDTASVLSEAIDYIKFLHEQVGALSTPYLKNGAPVVQHQQISDKSSEGAKQDLRSRGLCLVPVSSTFPMTHETPVDFWTPTFGGTFR